MIEKINRFSIAEANIQGEFKIIYSDGDWLALELESNLTWEVLDIIDQRPDKKTIYEEVNSKLKAEGHLFELCITSIGISWFDPLHSHEVEVGSPFTLIVGSPMFSISGSCTSGEVKLLDYFSTTSNYITEVANDMADNLGDYFELYIRKSLNLI